MMCNLATGHFLRVLALQWLDPEREDCCDADFWEWPNETCGEVCPKSTESADSIESKKSTVSKAHEPSNSCRGSHLQLPQRG
mmetsp:Transcript_50691/g.51075  ORF Transcript_50691/g.51075 Transcript_50691/m.51075 type:complete len:82 (+) Transcript_50691:271-516(+)